MSEWELWNDATGKVVRSGTEADVKIRYFELVEGGFPEMNLFVESPDQRQFAWNRNREPPGWDEI
jgi:hypothetical protein